MRLIKLVVVFLLVLSIAVPATAAEWVEVSTADKYASYIDEASITKKENGLVLYTSATKHFEPEKDIFNESILYTDSVSENAANCLQGTDAFLGVAYLYKGNVVNVFNVEQRNISFDVPSHPDSLRNFNFVCNKAGYGSDAFEKARRNAAQAVNDGRPNGAKSQPSRDSTSNKLTALWTTFWAIGLSTLLAYFLTKRFSFASPNTAHEQGMKWAAWLTMAIIIIRLSKYFITFDIEHLGMLVASLIFLIPIGYVAGFAYFKFRNRNASSTNDNSHAQGYVKEPAPAPIKTFSENKITSIQKDDEAVDLARYKQAADEIATGNRDDALWYKVFAEYGGDENATKAAYIRLRVEQLRRRAVHEDNMNKLWPTATTQAPQPTKPNLTKTLYDVLGVSREASKEQILAGYQLQKWELEAQENKDEDTAKKLVFIQHAKSILLDPARRAAYDARI